MFTNMVKCRGRRLGVPLRPIFEGAVTQRVTGGVFHTNSLRQRLRIDTSLGEGGEGLPGASAPYKVSAYYFLFFFIIKCTPTPTPRARTAIATGTTILTTLLGLSVLFSMGVVVVSVVD